MGSNVVVEQFGKEYRKEEIIRDIKPIKRVINGKNATIYQFKRCIWHGTMGNLFLINAEGYTEYLCIFTTALNSKPETIIMNCEERFSIEVTIKELKSSLCRESTYFEGKESNYGYIFILCLAYHFIHYLRLYIPDISFKDTLDGLSAYLLCKKTHQNLPF